MRQKYETKVQPKKKSRQKYETNVQTNLVETNVQTKVKMSRLIDLCLDKMTKCLDKMTKCLDKI